MPTFTHYYVQGQDKNGVPEVIYHSEDGYKFLDKKKAKDLLAAEKKINPEELYRVVKVTETYTAEEWM